MRTSRTLKRCDLSRQVATDELTQNKDELFVDDDANSSDKVRPVPTTDDLSPHVAADIFGHPYVKRLETELDRMTERYEKQVRRTEEVLIDGNKRLVELQQANAIANSETLAKYMLASRAGAPLADNNPSQEGDNNPAS